MPDPQKRKVKNMHFYATSAQIAEDFEVDYDELMKVVEEMQISEDFRKSHIQVFELRGLKIAQLTEPGYNAVIMNLPATSIADTATDGSIRLMKWREQFYMNRAPIISDVMNAPAPVQMPPAGLTSSPVRRSTTDENARRRAEDAINAGTYDQIMAASFADVHRKIMSDLNGDDPGYQNIRQYVIARRAAIGINL